MREKNAAAPEWLQKLLPEVETITKDITKGVREGFTEGSRQMSAEARRNLRKLTIGSALGGAAGAAASPGDRGGGALRGTLGGIVGGVTGAAWSRRPVVALAGSVAGGAAAGALGNKERPVKNKYAGVTLDWYDDELATLKVRFPTPDALPDIIKTADARPAGELANEDFALVAVDSGNVMRKYACHDPGTTAMSVIYFMEHGDKLPEGAQKVAAANLTEACLAHDIVPPTALVKASGVAFGAMPLGPGSPMGASPSGGMAPATSGPSPANGQRKPMHGPVARIEGEIEGMKRSLRILGADQGEQKLSASRGMSQAAEGFTGLISKARKAGVARTGRGIVGPRKFDVITRQKAKALGRKGDIEGGRAMRSFTEDTFPKVSSAIDITGQSPKPKVKTARPTDDADYAVVLPDGSRHYPINTWDRVKMAEDYYQENRVRMEPRVRRQFAVKLASQAAHMGYPLDYEIFDRGAVTYAPMGHMKAAIEMRKVACAPGDSREWLDELFEKRAHMEPGTYSVCLHRFDVDQGLDRGWDRVVLDPWESTFGINKIAEVVWERGADRVTDDQLQNLAQNHHSGLQELFSEDFTKEFIKDPKGIFDSMPDPQKKIIARLATDVASQGGAEVAL